MADNGGVGDDPALLERRADRCAEAGDYAAALALRERAFAGWRARGDRRRAAYLAAYLIAFDHVAFFGNPAVAQGWLERGAHLAEEAGDCVEAGWVALSRCLYAVDPRERAALAAEAHRIGLAFGDADLRFDALAYTGLALVDDGRIAEGMRRLDEAAAAARGGEVTSPVVAGEIYCKLLVACESTLDVRRAEQWQPVTVPFGERPAVAWVSAVCRTYYGGILVVAGRWDEAEHELGESLRLYDASYRALRASALARLAELRVRQGRLAEARQLLSGPQQDGFAVRPWARTEWLCAEDAAQQVAVVSRVARALRRRGGLLDVPTLALLAEMQVACGDLPAAGRTVQTMLDLSAVDQVDSLVGYARQSRACVLAAAGPGDPGVGKAVEELELAITHFTAAQLPLEAAGARLRLAQLLVATDPSFARAEAMTAAEAFAWLGATAELDRATALLRDLGGPARTGVRRGALLTDREEEVLALVSQGLSNPQIAERLFISRKTASHHVSNVLTKLGVRNRVEAAAWAVAHGQARRR